MLVAIIWIFGYSVNWMYTGFGIILCAAVMLPKFSAAKILPNPKLKKIKEKFLYKEEASNTASLHRSF